MFKDYQNHEYENRTIHHLLEMKERGSERELIIDVGLVTLAPADSQKTFNSD